MISDLELAWSPSTGWTNGKGRYFAVDPLPPRKSHEQIAAECRATNPGRDPLPPQQREDIKGTVLQRVEHQIDRNWISSFTIAQRLGIESRDRTGYQHLTRCIRLLWMGGTIERREFKGAGYHKFGTLMYRRKEDR